MSEPSPELLHELSAEERAIFADVRRAWNPTEPERFATFAGTMRQAVLVAGSSSLGVDKTEPGGLTANSNNVPRPHGSAAQSGQQVAGLAGRKLAAALSLSFGFGFVLHAGVAQQRHNEPGSMVKGSSQSDVAKPIAPTLPTESRIVTPEEEAPAASVTPSDSTRPDPSERNMASPAPAKGHPRPSSESVRDAPSALYEEMERVRQAQTALSQGRPLMALGILSDLDQTHAKGALRSERSMISILSLCELGRTSEAQARFRSGFPRGIEPIYRARLGSSCVAQQVEK